MSCTEEIDFSKLSFFPITYPILEKYYQKQKNVFWTPQEIDYQSDRENWNKLEAAPKAYIKFILLFFAQADGLINENLIDNFKKETSCYKEAKYFYAAQEFMEVIHNETYSMLIEAFIRDPEEKKLAFNAIQNYPIIRKIADWVMKWMKSDRPLHERVIAFACVEGIMFSSSFAAIYWIKRKNILKGLCKANEFIARDEAIHTEFAIALYHILTDTEKLHHKHGDIIYQPLDTSTVHQIISSATEVAIEFTKEAMKVDMVGLLICDMVSYVKCTADQLSTSLGYEKIYSVENPFDWMTVISLPNKSNFFETKVSEYGKQSTSNFDFDLEVDF
jgi:ribonucleoside-diphosphate reductase subunit M2